MVAGTTPGGWTITIPELLNTRGILWQLLLKTE